MARVNKFKSIEKLLVDRGYITNFECLNGSPDLEQTDQRQLFVTRRKYIIDTEIKRYPYGGYEDCVYKYRGVL